MADLVQLQLGDRVLTVKQPWADLIMAGVKDVENRSWPVPSTLPQWWLCTDECCRHYGEPRIVPSCGAEWWAPDGPFPFRLWIHAGKTFARDQRAWDEHARHWRGEPIGRYLLERKQRGVLLGSVDVTGCHHADDTGCVQRDPSDEYVPCSPWAQEDAYHWTLTVPQPLDQPIPAKGALGLWHIPEGLVAA